MHVQDHGRVLEAMPPELVAWARAAHRPLASARASGEPARDGAGATTEDVRIEHPAAGAHYYLEASRARRLQSIGVRVRAPRRASTITLRVDGREVARARSGEALEWIPSPGRHALVAEAAGGASEPVYVDVD